MIYRFGIRAALAVLYLASFLTTGSDAVRAQTAAPPRQIEGDFGDWNVACETAPPGTCYMIAIGHDPKGNPLVEFSIIRLPADPRVAAGGTVVVPLGTALPEGLILQVDQGERLRYAYDFCAPAGCVANLALTQEQVAAMQGGVRAFLTVAPAANPEMPVTAPVSLRGFTAAFKTLSTLRE